MALCSSNIPRYTLHRGQMLLMGGLHEPAQVSNNKSEIGSCVCKVPEPPYDPPLLCGVDARSVALLAQLQAGFHWCLHWIALMQTTAFQEFGSVGSLTECDVAVTLVNLYPKIVG
jgi:hypothetical protein